jgi:hypothetical protein
MTALSRFVLRGEPSLPQRRKLVAADLTTGDNLEVDRGRGFERVISMARHDGSRTVDCLFESGRRRTYQFNADLSIGSD